MDVFHGKAQIVRQGNEATLTYFSVSGLKRSETGEIHNATRKVHTASEENLVAKRDRSTGMGTSRKHRITNIPSKGRIVHVGIIDRTARQLSLHSTNNRHDAISANSGVVF